MLGAGSGPVKLLTCWKRPAGESRAHMSETCGPVVRNCTRARGRHLPGSAFRPPCVATPLHNVAVSTGQSTSPVQSPLDVQLRQAPKPVAEAANGCIPRLGHRTAPCRECGTWKAASPLLQVPMNKTTSPAWTRTGGPAKPAWIAGVCRLGVISRTSRTRRPTGGEPSAVHGPVPLIVAMVCNGRIGGMEGCGPHCSPCRYPGR